MGHQYVAVSWNQQKKTYDKWLWAGIVGLLLVAVVSDLLLNPDTTVETLIIRATALTAIILLHLLLMIGPLTRLDSRFLPLLYNRRHMGVSLFMLAAIHGVFGMIQFHSLGDTNMFVSVFTSNEHYRSISDFPFQTLGFMALCIFFLMAITSHDFWLKNLSPVFWKWLHMGVYLAYGLLIGHIALGTLQYESSAVYGILLGGGFLCITGLHTYTGWLSISGLRQQRMQLDAEGFVCAARIEDITMDCAKAVFVNGQNIAIFRYDDKVAAVSNICRHQLGPLGEGKVIDGCITCPWHGYQYRPENGQSPPPFDEKIETYDTRIVKGEIWVNPTPHPPGTAVTLSIVESAAS